MRDIILGLCHLTPSQILRVIPVNPVIALLGISLCRSWRTLFFHLVWSQRQNQNSGNNQSTLKQGGEELHKDTFL